MTQNGNITRRSILYATAAAPVLTTINSPTAITAPVEPTLPEATFNADETPLTNQEILGDVSDILSEGRTAPAKDEAAWDALLKQFFKQYSVFVDTDKATQPGQEMFTLGLNPRIRRIDDSFRYIAQNKLMFNPFRVETLMNQVADLLDRSLITKREWEDNATKGANLFLDVIKFIREER